MKKHIPAITIFTIIIGIITLGIYFSERDSTINKELTKLNVYSEEELSFLEEQGFLNNIDSENLPNNKEQVISLLKSPNLIEQNLNSPDESFEVLATKLDENTYQLAFKLENKSNQSKEFYLIPISESSQTEFKEIKGVVKGGKVSWGDHGDWTYDIEKHKQELRPELAQAYDDIDNNGYTGKPIRLVLEANSTLLAQSKWEIIRGPSSDSLKPVYLLVYGSAGGVKDELTILTVHSHPKEGDYWRVSFETKGLRDLYITPNDQNTINDMDFVSLKCGDEERIPQILENDVILYENWYCFEEAEVIHIINKTDHHYLKFQFGKQEAFAYNSPDLIDNLVSYWKLDESSGNAVDVHGSNDATSVVGVNYGATGKIGDAYDFPGTDDYVEIADHASLDSANITISTWIKADSFDNAFPRIVAKDNDSSKSYTMAVEKITSSTALAFFRFRDEGWIGGYFDTILSAGSWYHLVATYDGSTVKMYVNGSLDTRIISHSGAIETSTSVVRFGNKSDNTDFDWNGLIDEVGIWNRALTQDEVTALYNGGDGWAYPFTFTGEAVRIKGGFRVKGGLKIKF